jgi:anthranilate synthase/aminodeoxychorismate synthase-like glutamine amidotransferase
MHLRARSPAARSRPVLVVDNYDSFVHNVVDELVQLGARVEVRRNDAVGIEEVLRGGFRGIVLSPGPGRPADAGISVPLIRRLPAALPLLGICLGHQALAEAFGGRIVRAVEPLHGRATPIHHRGAGLLQGLPDAFPAARYHSLVVDPARSGRDLVVTARSERGEIMGLRHRRRPLEGVQFHPESYLTPDGPRILAAFLGRTGLRTRDPRTVVR